MNNFLLTYSHSDSCGNFAVSAKYVVDNLVMCENRVNTHTHTHTFSSRVFYRKYIKYQNISKPREEEISHLFFRGAAMFRFYQRVSNSFFPGFANRFLRLLSTQWCSAPPCGGSHGIALSYYGVIGRHSSCLVGSAVFSCKPLTSKNERYEGRKKML